MSNCCGKIKKKYERRGCLNKKVWSTEMVNKSIKEYLKSVTVNINPGEVTLLDIESCIFSTCGTLYVEASIHALYSFLL